MTIKVMILWAGQTRRHCLIIHSQKEDKMGVARVITIFLIITGKLSDVTSTAFTVS